MAKTAVINGLSIEYEVVKRKIRYPRLEYKSGQLLMVLPEEYDDESWILQRHGEWLYKKELEIRRALEESKKKQIHLERTRKELYAYVQKTIEDTKKHYPVRVNKVFYRDMKTKWGSYSPKGNLTINPQLRYLPDELVRYVVVHELMHSLEKKHNERYWKNLGVICMNYIELEKELFPYWFKIQQISREGEIAQEIDG